MSAPWDSGVSVQSFSYNQQKLSRMLATDLIWTHAAQAKFLMHKDRRTLKFWIQVHAQSNRATEMMKNSTRLSVLDIVQKALYFFSKDPSPLILLLSGWIFHRNTYGCHWSANKLPLDFLLASKTRHLCPWIQSNHNSALQREEDGEWGVRAGLEEEGDDRSRWGGRANGGRELTHMWQDRAVLLMGKEKYNNLKKKDDRYWCGFFFYWTPLGHFQQHLSYGWQAR